MRRVPGINVVDVPQAADDSLPPMDIPVFVGFAEKGPLHRPVLLRDVAHYERIFGGTLDLLTAEDGTPCRAHLSAAVNAFFSGGGQRCHVIRVAAQSEQARPVTGRFAVSETSLAWRRGGTGPWAIAQHPVHLRASSAGAWTDGLELSARLASVALRPTDEVAIGDVLRISGSSPGTEALSQVGVLRVSESSLLANPQPQTRVDAKVAIERELLAAGVLWLSAALPPAGFRLEQIERLTIDLLVRERFSTRAEGIRRWQRDGCALASGASEALPWFEPNLEERWDREQAMPEGDWPCAGMLPEEVATSDGSLFSSEAERDRDFDLQWMIVPRNLASEFVRWSGVESGSGDPLERNGLAQFEAELFLDPAYPEGVNGEALVQWAEQVRYLGTTTRALKGIHAALGYGDSPVRAATWVAVPDAVHVGWRVEAPLPLSEGRVQLQVDPVCDCPPKTFDLCTPPPARPAPPVIRVPGEVPAGAEWPLHLLLGDVVPQAGRAVRIEIQLAQSADFDDARPLPLSFQLGQHAPALPHEIPEWALSVPSSTSLSVAVGRYYVRARTWRAPVLVPATAGNPELLGPALVSDWSASTSFAARSAKRVLLQSPSVAADSIVQRVHAALIDVVSAQRERFALLSVPVAWTEDDVGRHVQLLRRRILAREDALHTLSFAAIHHPWLQQVDPDGRVMAHPPEGAVLGQYAERTRRKGCWSAAGLDALAQCRGLGSVLDAGALEAVGCNPIEVRPRGISATAAQTLDLDRDWSSIGVRRLFILLRKLVRREGERFAFESNDRSLRSRLEHGFEELLRRLLQAGALQGDDASGAYRLRTASGVELSREIERGQCSLEIQVAPSRPLRFLTLYAVRSADALQLEERS